MGKAKIDRWVDFSELPKKINSKGDESIVWSEVDSLELKFKYDYIEGIIKILRNDKLNKKLVIQYLDYDEYCISYGNFRNVNLQNCIGYDRSKYYYEINEHIIDDKRNMIILDRKYQVGEGFKFKYYKYKCLKCGFDCNNTMFESRKSDGYWMLESSLKDGKGCASCSKNSRIVIQGINDIPTTAPWMVKYFQGGYDESKLYLSSTHTKFTPMCPHCGRIKNKPMSILNLYRTRSIGCSCGDGFNYSEKVMRSIFEYLKLDFISELGNNTFRWITNNYRYDFYIPSLKLIIEVDGGFHRKDNTMNGQTKEESKFMDNEKDRLAKENGYEVMRIIYDHYDLNEFKFSIIKSELSNVLNLDSISWDDIDKLADRNICKEVCLYRVNNPCKTLLETSLIFNLSDTTVVKYINKGKKFGWMDNYKKVQNQGKRIIVLKDGEEVCNLNSTMDLVRDGESLFGVDFKQSSVSKAIKENIEYKGFFIKFSNEMEG